MSNYQDLINKGLNPKELADERKSLISKIQKERKRKLIVYASDSKEKAPYLINNEDITCFSNLITTLKGVDKIDILIHSSGGFAEAAEMIVNMLRDKFNDIDFIVPRFAKSAATMIVCSGNKILMDFRSELGPIDPQILLQGKRYAADAFLEGVSEILKKTEGKRLNPAYLPILQNITPADMQAAENAKALSVSMVKKWLSKYMFKNLPKAKKQYKSNKISKWLGSHKKHLSHGKPITIDEAKKQGLTVEDYSKNSKLSSLIWDLYCNIELTFSMTNAYKIYESETVQLFKQIQITKPQGKLPSPKKVTALELENKCNKCGNIKTFQLKFLPTAPPRHTPYPKNDKFICEVCGNNIGLKQARLKAEGMVGKKAILE